MENVSLIDVSSEDDLLITSSSDRLQDHRPSENCDEGNCMKKLESANAYEGDNPMKMSRQLEQCPELSKSPEQKKPKPGKVNLRKSLAWDNAFFTSEGVLNTEELAIVNSTFRKTEACSLPGIQEELRRSTESTSTLDSECYTVENIEEDLFENVRASIQKTLSKSNSSVTREQDASHHGSRKKVELPFQTKAAKGSGDAKLSLKPPRVVPKPTLLTVRSSKDSSGSLQNKNTIRRTSSGGANQQVALALPKTTGDSSIMASRSLKPSPGSRTIVYSTVSSSSSSPANNSSSQLAGKSPLESTRKRSALRNTTKTPTATSKSRLGLSNTQRHQTCASSTLKLPSGMSPSSSIDSFSSEASSSTSASIKPSKSVESFASSTSSTPSLAFSTDTDAYQPTDSTDQPFVNKGASGNLLLSRHVAKAPTNTHISGAKSFKPSGLRMPSPKIGYFDAEKTLVSNPSKFSQSSVRSSLLKSTAATKDPIKAEKSKSSKIPSIRTTVQHVSMNFGSSKSLSIPKSPSMRPASSMLMHQLPNSAHLHKHLSPVSSKDCHRIEGNGSKDSGQVSFAAADNRAQATYEICKEEKHKTYGLSQDGVENETRCGSKMIQKENLLPVYETAGVIHYLQSSGQKVSAVEIMDKKMASLLLSEASNFVNGD